MLSQIPWLPPYNLISHHMHTLSWVQGLCEGIPRPIQSVAGTDVDRSVECVVSLDSQLHGEDFRAAMTNNARRWDIA